MQTASLSDLKKELSGLPAKDLAALCLRMAKYKKENKELLHYLLFEAGNESRYVQELKEELRPEFGLMNKSQVYFAKKTVRKILRIVKKHIKYSGSKETEADLLIFFCEELKATGLPIRHSKVLLNLYERQLAAIKKALAGLHEDLQYDYLQKLETLSL